MRFFDILVHWAKNSGLSSKSFQRAYNHCVPGVHWNVLRKNKKRIFRKKYKYYIILGDCKETFGGVVKTAFTERIGSLCRSIFWNTRFIPFFFMFSETFSATRQKLCGEVVITAIFMSRATYWGKIENGFCERSINFLSLSETGRKLRRGGHHYIQWDNRNLMRNIFLNFMTFSNFLYKERKVSGFSSKTLQRGCNHWIICVHMIILTKNKKGISRKKYNFYILLGDC